MQDYKLSILSYTSSTSLATVTFKNEASGEYIFYDLKLTASAPASRGTVSLECPVRTQTSQRVSLKNPLQEDVTIKASVNSKLVSRRSGWSGVEWSGWGGGTGYTWLQWLGGRHRVHVATVFAM